MKCHNFIYRQHRGFVAAFASGNTSKAPSSNSLENRLRPIGLCRIASYICVNWFKSVRSLKHFILQIADKSMDDFFGFSLHLFCYTYVSYSRLVGIWNSTNSLDRIKGALSLLYYFLPISNISISDSFRMAAGNGIKNLLKQGYSDCVLYIYSYLLIQGNNKQQLLYRF